MARRFPAWWAGVLVGWMVLGTIGCAGPKPVLYPNDHLNQVGAAQAERDIAECRARADEYVASNKTGRVAGSTVLGAGTGAATGAVGGAVSGGSAGRGAAVGAATGATFGLIRGLFASSKPSRTYRNFVNRCLREKGYEPLGWD